jgi:hypothetical protein
LWQDFSSKLICGKMWAYENIYENKALDMDLENISRNSCEWSSFCDKISKAVGASLLALLEILFKGKLGRCQAQVETTTEANRQLWPWKYKQNWTFQAKVVRTSLETSKFCLLLYLIFTHAAFCLSLGYPSASPYIYHSRRNTPQYYIYANTSMAQPIFNELLSNASFKYNNNGLSKSLRDSSIIISLY